MAIMVKVEAEVTNYDEDDDDDAIHTISSLYDSRLVAKLGNQPSWVLNENKIFCHKKAKVGNTNTVWKF